MGVTRRQFLECAALAAVPRWSIDRLAPLVRPPTGIVILDLGTGCSLRESVSGFQRTLGAAVVRSDLPATTPATLIVPAAVDLQPVAARAIGNCLEASGRVILETGLPFAPVGRVASHRTALVELLGIHIGPPVSLWSPAGAPRIPYVDFNWPGRALVRDYSHVVPLEARGDTVIAAVDGLPVALTGSRGKGRVIFLGSPIGPALWAGDAAARGWLEAVLNVR